MARYNFERFSNNLARVVRFNNFREPIVEAYFPKMDSLVASRAWPARASNTRISDLNRELDQIRYDVRDLEQWVSRFVEACHQGFVQDVRSMFNLFDLCGNSKPKNEQTSISSAIINRGLLLPFACKQVSGNRIMLDERNGINLLGNIMESSQLSVNRDFYG